MKKWFREWRGVLLGVVVVLTLEVAAVLLVSYLRSPAKCHPHATYVGNTVLVTCT
jgi:hypothetical protein